MSDQSRRKLLKSIAAGSGAVIAGKNLPENWVKPVVDSVMLPAHAQTSMCAFGISATATLPYASTPPGPDVVQGSTGSWTITVTPAPADGEQITLEAYFDGVLNITVLAPLVGGTVTVGINAILTGVLEYRATYDCAVSSIYMNVLPAQAPGTPAGSAISILG